MSGSRISRAARATVALAFLACAARADEGMWTFDNFPSAAMRSVYGWGPDQAWLDRVMAGSARLEGGCSAGIVSRNGLVQTNHHCVVDCVQNLSTPGQDLVSSGFSARRQEEERRCEGAAVQVLERITDVTADIGRAVAGAGANEFTRRRDAEIARLERACMGDAPQRRCQVVTLYQGGQYKLYTYRRYDDVRLVFAPELNAAFFGGDPDNFNFPRYAFDVAYLRLYEGGRPAQTPAFLPLRTTPLTDGEVTMISGNPGGTSRLISVAQMSFLRDVHLPWRLATLAELRGRLLQFSAQGPEQARIASDTLFNVENTFKALSGERGALSDPQGFQRAARAQEEMQRRVAANPELTRLVGPAWQEIAAAQERYRGFFFAHQYVEQRAGGGSELFAYARDLVRAAQDRTRPDAERLPRYTQSRLATTEAETLAATPVDAPLEEILLSFWLSKMREYLTADDPLARQILGRESPEGLAHRLVSQTRLADPAERRRLWEGGASAIAASDDPMIVFARRFDAQARVVRRRFEEEVEGPIARAQERIAQARFRAYGASQYPDATFTLRLSFGRVAGWREPGGRAVAPFTTFSGLYERATGAAPFALTERWRQAQGRLNGGTIFNASTTNDIIGGNSGSPVLDREGRVVGAAFDGNIHSLGGEYFYDPELNRTVIVASTAILEGLRVVYRMDSLARELEGR